MKPQQPQKPKLDRKAVGQRIRQIYIESGLGEAGFAKRVGVSKDMIHKWFRGVNLPKPERLEIIAKIGNTTPEWILYGSFSPNLDTLREANEKMEHWKYIAETQKVLIESQNSLIEDLKRQIADQKTRIAVLSSLNNNSRPR